MSADSSRGALHVARTDKFVGKFPGQCGVELVYVVLAHAGQEVQAFGIEGCRAGHANRRDDPRRDKSRAAQRIRSATGITENKEPLRTQRVRDSLRVGYHVRDPPAGVTIRTAVTCAVEATSRTPSAWATCVQSEGRSPDNGVPWW